MTAQRLTQVFVDTIPTDLEDGVLYVSIEFRTTMHLCACGCGNPVVLPLRPAAWALTYNGDCISMNPSIGNWSFDCRSHYWIRGGRVIWASPWSDEQIKAGRQRTLVERGAVGADDLRLEDARPGWRRVLRRAARMFGLPPQP